MFKEADSWEKFLTSNYPDLQNWRLIVTLQYVEENKWVCYREPEGQHSDSHCVPISLSTPMIM